LSASNEPGKLLEALQTTSWNKSKAAELLHCSRMTIYRKIAKFKLAPEGCGVRAEAAGVEDIRDTEPIVD
jgi:hypothetical protein